MYINISYHIQHVVTSTSQRFAVICEFSESGIGSYIDRSEQWLCNSTVDPVLVMTTVCSPVINALIYVFCIGCVSEVAVTSLDITGIATSLVLQP